MIIHEYTPQDRMIVEHEREAEHLLWPAQTPDLNILKTHRGVWEEVRKHFLPPASHSDLTTVVEEERLEIPLATVKDLYVSFLR